MGTNYKLVYVLMRACWLRILRKAVAVYNGPTRICCRSGVIEVTTEILNVAMRVSDDRALSHALQSSELEIERKH